MKCPKCGNNYCCIEALSKSVGKDYSVGRGFLGEMFFGASGFVLGMSNSYEVNVDAYWVCKRCGNKFKV